jgi:hypothetical protein
MRFRAPVSHTLAAFAVLASTTAHAREPGEVPRKVVHRRAIAAVAEFPDRALEDWDGTGISSMDDLHDRLDDVAAHWAWLSRGRETLEWTVVRILLPEPLQPDSYAGDLALFRTTTAALVREQVELRRFDADRDGELDSVFVLVANRGDYFPWLGRGVRPDGGAHQFVETQNAYAFVTRAPGYVTSQLAETRGVHDLGGPFNNVGALSVMSRHWLVPPADFTAVERAALGWLKPRRILPGHHRVRLVDDGDEGRVMDAARVDTARLDEYVLLEFRHPHRTSPDAVSPPEDGVVVHHVLEGSNPRFDPPFHRIVPADGSLPPGHTVDVDDLFTPDTATFLPVVVSSVVDAAPVLRIDDVERDGADTFVVTLTVFAPPPRTNLLQQGGFELGTATTAEGWRSDAWTSTSQFFRDRWRPFEGRFSASIKSTTGNDARWAQDVDGLTPGSPYLLCAALRGRDVTRAPGVEVGANLSVLGMGWFDRSEAIVYGTFGWRRVCYPFRAPSASATVTCRLGFYSSLARGQLWCDDVTLEPLDPMFASP